jgi:hypothetical protein
MLKSGQVQADEERARTLLNHAMGLMLVVISLALIYTLTLPGELRFTYAICGVTGVLGIFLGMPLLVTGRLRQPKGPQ